MPESSPALLQHYVVALAVTAVSMAALATMVIARDRKLRLHRAFAAYYYSVAWWSGVEAVSIAVRDGTLALWLWRLNHVGVILIPIFFHDFAIHLDPKGPTPGERRALRGLYLLAAALLAANCTPLLILEVAPKLSFRWFIEPGPGYLAFFALWQVLLCAGLWRLVRRWWGASGELRQRMTLFCIGQTLAYVGGMTNFLPTFDIELPGVMPWATYSIPAFAAVTVYAILRHRLLDINVLITRTGLFLAVYVIVLGVPLVVGLWGGNALRARLGQEWWLVPAGLSTLLATVGPLAYARARGRAEDILLRRLAEKEREASTDGLTGLLTRGAFMAQAANAVAASGEARRPCCLLMADLDHFKQVNDTHGHLVGDLVLQNVARQVAAGLRGHDLVGRYGGEEFVLLLPDTTAGQGREVAERVRARVERSRVQSGALNLASTLSIGVACTDGLPTQLVDLVARADAALYRAKHQGRNRVSTPAEVLLPG